MENRGFNGYYLIRARRVRKRREEKEMNRRNAEKRKKGKTGFTPLETHGVRGCDVRYVQPDNGLAMTAGNGLRKRRTRFLSLTGFTPIRDTNAEVLTCEHRKSFSQKTFVGRRCGILKSLTGFTLVEIMTTVVIVGVISSIAIPQFMNARMATNMELMRQQMRIIGQKMNDIMTNKGEFPAEADWPLTGTIDPDELAVTASLSAIDDMCYTTDDYRTSANGKGYRFCSAPKLDACGRWAGNKRFCVHMDSKMSALFAPGVVGEVDLWEGEGSSMWFKQALSGGSILDDFLADQVRFTNEEKTDMIARSLINEALYGDYEILSRYESCAECLTTPFSTFLIFESADKATYDAILPDIYKRLEAAGIFIEQIEITPSEALQKITAYAGGYATFDINNQLNGVESPLVIEMSFKLADRVETEEEYMTRRAEWVQHGSPLTQLQDMSWLYGYD